MADEGKFVQKDSSEGRVELTSILTSPEVICLGYLSVVLLTIPNPQAMLPVPDPLRVVLGVVFVCFLPGYAVLAALYPARTESSGWFSLGGPGLTWRDRLALSVAVSLALLPLVGLGLTALGLGLGTTTIVASIAVVVVVGVAISGVRRLRLPADERHVVPYKRWQNDLRATFSTDRGRRARALDLLLLLVVFVSVFALAGAVTAPPAGESYSDLHLLSENSGGESVASSYPVDLVPGEEYQYVIGIDSHEEERTTYHVVAELQRVSTTETELTVLERQRVDRFEVTLPPGERVQEPRTVVPQLEGQDLRLVYYLYRGEPRQPPTAESAYRSVYVWVDVEAQQDGS